MKDSFNPTTIGQILLCLSSHDFLPKKASKPENLYAILGSPNLKVSEHPLSREIRSIIACQGGEVDFQAIFEESLGRRGGE